MRHQLGVTIHIHKRTNIFFGQVRIGSPTSIQSAPLFKFKIWSPIWSTDEIDRDFNTFSNMFLSHKQWRTKTNKKKTLEMNISSIEESFDAVSTPILSQSITLNNGENEDNLDSFGDCWACGNFFIGIIHVISGVISGTESDQAVCV